MVSFTIPFPSFLVAEAHLFQLLEIQMHCHFLHNCSGFAFYQVSRFLFSLFLSQILINFESNENRFFLRIFYVNQIQVCATLKRTQQIMPHNKYLRAHLHHNNHLFLLLRKHDLIFFSKLTRKVQIREKNAWWWQLPAMRRREKIRN